MASEHETRIEALQERWREFYLERLTAGVDPGEEAEAMMAAALAAQFVIVGPRVISRQLFLIAQRAGHEADARDAAVISEAEAASKH